MRSFLLGAPVEGAFNIPFQVVKGEAMKTIKAISSSNKITELKQAFAVGDIAPNKNYVLKSAASGTIVQYSIFFFQTDSDGNLSNYVFRMPGYNPYPASTFTGTAKISAGDEFYELDRPY